MRQTTIADIKKKSLLKSLEEKNILGEEMAGDVFASEGSKERSGHGRRVLTVTFHVQQLKQVT